MQIMSANFKLQRYSNRSLKIFLKFSFHSTREIFLKILLNFEFQSIERLIYWLFNLMFKFEKKNCKRKKKFFFLKIAMLNFDKNPIELKKFSTSTIEKLHFEFWTIFFFSPPIIAIFNNYLIFRLLKYSFITE